METVGPLAGEIVESCKTGDSLRLRKIAETHGKKAVREARDHEGYTPLHWVCLANGLDTVNFLIECGIDVNDSENTAGVAPLHWAAIGGHILVIDTLLQNHANLNKVDKLGYSCVHHAVQNGHTLLTHYLSEKGADLKAMDFEGHTPLHWAAFKGDSDTINYLLNHGANVNAYDVTRSTALHWAALKGHDEAVRLLVEFHADVNAKDNQGLSPVHYAKDKDINFYLTFVAKRGLERISPNLKANPRLNLFIIIVPWFMYPLWFYLFSMAHIVLLIISGFFMLGFLGFFQPYVWPNRRANTPFPCSYSAATVFYLWLFYFIYLRPVTPEYPIMHLYMNFHMLTTVYLFYKSSTIEPGFILPPKSVVLTGSEIVKETRDSGLKPKEFCPTCLIRKPMRAKHCRLCNQCVARFDHHCPWINACVAVNNHGTFLVTISFFAGALYIIWFSSYSYLITRLDFSSIFMLFYSAYFEEAPAVLVAGWTTVHALWLTLLVYVQIRAIFNNTLIHERLAEKKFGYINGYNPFNHGYINNVKDFINRKDSDWSRIFSTNDLYHV